MKAVIISLSIVLLFLCQSCGLSSFYPLVPESQGVNIPELCGTWKSDKKEHIASKWVISLVKDQEYRLEYTEKKKGNRVICNLRATRFDKDIWLDIYPNMELTSKETKNKVQNTLLMSSLVASHVIVKVTYYNSEEIGLELLTAAAIKDINDAIKQTGSADTLQLLDNNQNTLLIAETSLLQSALHKYSNLVTSAEKSKTVLKKAK